MVTLKIANVLCSGKFRSSHPRAVPFVCVSIPDRRRSDRLGRIAFRAFKESAK